MPPFRLRLLCLHFYYLSNKRHSPPPITPNYKTGERWCIPLEKRFLFTLASPPSSLSLAEIISPPNTQPASTSSSTFSLVTLPPPALLATSPFNPFLHLIPHYHQQGMQKSKSSNVTHSEPLGFCHLLLHRITSSCVTTRMRCRPKLCCSGSSRCVLHSLQGQRTRYGYVALASRGEEVEEEPQPKGD